MENDFVGREVAMQYIKDNQCKGCSDIGLCGNCAVLIALKLIEWVPAADVVQEENILKFYYVRSIDEYWIGRRLDTLYYARCESENQQWIWTHSRYLPWGEHVVSPTSLWKEYTYPSEPEEIPFTDWLQGFVKKHIAADVRPVVRGKWIEHDFGGGNISYECSECHEVSCCNGNYCTDCGADMRESNLDTTKGGSHD